MSYMLKKKKKKKIPITNKQILLYLDIKENTISLFNGNV